MRNSYVVSYDIADPKRLRKAARETTEIVSEVLAGKLVNGDVIVEN